MYFQLNASEIETDRLSFSAAASVSTTALLKAVTTFGTYFSILK